MQHKFTFADKAAAIERELSYRRRVYPRRVAAQQMTQALADIKPLVGTDDAQRPLL